MLDHYLTYMMSLPDALRLERVAPRDSMDLGNFVHVKGSRSSQYSIGQHKWLEPKSSLWTFLLNVMLEVVQFPFSPHFSLQKLSCCFIIATYFLQGSLFSLEKENISQSFTSCSSFCTYWQPLHLKRTAFIFLLCLGGCATARSFLHNKG